MAKPALGKGFDALINQNLSRESLAAPQAGDVVHQLSHAAIIPSSLQPRAIFTPEQLAELVDSIKEHGIIQPLIVRKTQSGKYELIAGERRWRASGILGLSTVPAIIREASDKDVLELALIENLQRENLSPLEEAAGYMRLKTEFRMKQGDIAKRVGKSRAAVANSMRLLDLPQPVQDMLGNTFISVGHAKVLLSLKNKDQQIQLGRDIVNKGYTVRQTIALLAEKGVNTEEALTEAAQTGDFDYDFIDNESEDLSRLEGFLFPDTYEFYVGHNAEDALDRLIRNFVSRMDEDRMTQVEESSYSLQEIITIASLIEEETDGTDQANIASVIYNRLEGSGNKQGTYGLLQIDASLLYALPDHTGPITSADMQTDSPYNLYQNAGLPPTPISNPGLASIDAALNPNSTDYYYYALGTDGKHHFSTTLAEHNAFVNSSSYGG